MENRILWETRFRVLNPDTGALEEKLDVSMNINESGIPREKLGELFKETSEKVFEIIAEGSDCTEYETETGGEIDNCFKEKRGWFK